MGSRIWVRQDVLNALRAAHLASEGSVAALYAAAQGLGQREVSADELLAAYRSGFAAALTAVGAAFGLGEPGVMGPVGSLSPDVETLPWTQQHTRVTTTLPTDLARLLMDTAER